MLYEIPLEKPFKSGLKHFKNPLVSETKRSASTFEIFTIGLFYTMQVSIEKFRVKFVEVGFKIQFLNRLSLRKYFL